MQILDFMIITHCNIKLELSHVISPKNIIFVQTTKTSQNVFYPKNISFSQTTKYRKIGFYTKTEFSYKLQHVTKYYFT